MNWTIIAGVGLGALGGAWLGSLRTCESGTCPLTANPYRGALFGAVIGLALTIGSVIPGASGQSANAVGQADAEPGAAAIAAPDAGAEAAGADSVREITAAADFDALTKGTGLNVVRFHAVWCGPCRAYEPIFASVAGKVGAKAKFYAVDVDQMPAAAQSSGIRVLPTTVIFRDGREVGRMEGLVSAQDLLSRMNESGT